MLVLFAISLFASNVFSQGMYVRLNAGYGMGASSQNLEDFSNYTRAYRSSNGSYDYTYEQVDISLGKGLNLGGALGYMFSSNFGAELGVSYLLGGKSTATETYNGSSSSDIYEYSISAKMFRINPSIILTTGSEGLSPYAKFGVIVGMGSIQMEYEYTDTEDGDVSIEKLKLDGGIALGLSAALGVNYKLSESMSLFGEINMVNMSYAPTKGEVTEATYNGANELPDYTTNEKLTDFVDSYSYNSQDNQSENEPDKELKQKMPFGSFGLNLGLHIKF